MNITNQLSAFIVDTHYDDLPEAAIEQAKLLILDSLGVSLAGTRCSIGEITLNLGREMLQGSDATVIGTNYKASVADAAYLNGTLAHALDMDDSAAGTVAHPSASLVPALFALAEKYGASGKDFLTAYILGLETFYRIALASDGQMGGWHRTAIFGAPATAAACAKLMGSSAEQIATAIGIATSLTSGVQINFGSMTKAVQVGNASRSGVIAALLARDGCTAHPDALGDAQGFGHAFYDGNFKTELLVKDLGDPWSIIFPGIGMKQYPCCGLNHAPLDLALELAKREDINVDEVDTITVYVEVLVPEVLVHHRPSTGFQGKYSLEYCIAAALHDREITPDTFTDESVNRLDLQAYLSKTETKTRSDADWAASRLHIWNHPAEMIIRMKNGTEHTAMAPCARGYPDLAFTKEEVLRKFDQCAASILTSESLSSIKKHILSLETQTNVANIIAMT
jgi:2-methylcitrate dehydratase PrpD